MRASRPDWKALVAAALMAAAPCWAETRSANDIVIASRLAVEAESEARIAALRREAIAFEHGEGVVKDIGRAMALYCEAARMGDAEAQYALGWIYANGRGVARDDERAAVFFALAAAQGHLHAQRAQAFAGNTVGRLPDCMLIDRAGMFGAEGAFDFSVLESLNPQKRRMIELTRKLAPEYSVHPQLALAVIAVESNFNPRARSPKNAQGLMQLIPSTAQRFKVKDVLDPTQNIKGGLSYLRWLLSYYRGRVDLAVAAYNAGEGAVDRYRGIPPYRETQDYVKRVRRFYGGAQHPFDGELTEPSPVVQLM